MQKKDISTAKLPPILYQGSVKNLRGHSNSDQIIFEYSDRYSVFDWGEMPDALEKKGLALAAMAELFFIELEKPWKQWTCSDSGLAHSVELKKLQTEGLITHRVGLVDENENSISLPKTSRYWKVKSCARELPNFTNGKFDYSFYQTPAAKKPEKLLLIPLEVVFRFGAPHGSSFFKRATAEYCQELGLSQIPSANDKFSKIVIEYFTKLEPSDRFLKKTEAKVLAGLSDEEEMRLRTLTSLIALRVKDLFASIGLDLWDGKFEFAFTPEREICLVDAIGPDELRLLSASGIHVSKEILRKFYRNTSWYDGIEKAKMEAERQGEPQWKTFYLRSGGKEPDLLPISFREAISNMYLGLANALAQKIIGSDVFPGITLETSLKNLQSQIGDHK